MHILYNIIAFCAGAIIGVVLTACIVAADWYELLDWLGEEIDDD